MNALSWASISEQLRTIGVEVPVTGAGERRRSARLITYRPLRNLMCRRSSDHPRADKPNPDPLTTILAAAKKAGVPSWSVCPTANSSSRVWTIWRRMIVKSCKRT